LDSSTTESLMARQKKSTADWPVRLATCESAIRKQDEYVFKHAPSYVDIIVKATSVRVEENGQTSTLEFLYEQGCPKRELLYLLGMCENRGVTNALKMTGYNSAALKQKLHEVEECASAIEQVNGHAVREGWGGTEFGKLLEMANVKRSTLASFLQLPLHLREYGSLVEHAARYLGGKSDFYLSLAKALLVAFVRQRTHDDHHKEVADLLSAMLGEEYGRLEHGVWRNLYQKRLMNYQPDPADPPSLLAKKTLLESAAAILYRMDVLHPGEKYVRQKRSTALRLSDLA
jgi:hypothetical protein